MQPGRGLELSGAWSTEQPASVVASATTSAGTTRSARGIGVHQLPRGTPPRFAGRDDVSLLALGSLFASPSSPWRAVADEGRSPMTVAGPRRIHTGFLPVFSLPFGRHW